MDQNINKCGWRVALARLSKSLSGKQAEIEIAALRLGGQIVGGMAACHRSPAILKTTASK